MYLQRPSHTQTCTDMYRDTQIWVRTEMCAYNDLCRDLCSETCMHANMPTDTAAQKCPRRWIQCRRWYWVRLSWTKALDGLLSGWEVWMSYHSESPLQNTPQSTSSRSYFRATALCTAAPLADFYWYPVSQETTGTCLLLMSVPCRLILDFRVLHLTSCSLPPRMQAAAGTRSTSVRTTADNRSRRKRAGLTLASLPHS